MLFWAYDKVLFALTMDAVIVVSETIRKQITACRLLPESKVFCIFNGINAEPFIGKDDKKMSALKEAIGLTEVDFVIGTVARLVWFKGLQTLISALPNVLATCQQTRLLIVGDGPLRQELEQQSRQLGIHERVFFLGEREDVSDLLTLLDVFVLPSVSEGMPITILEAMAAAKPIVATRVGGIPDTVSEGQTALLVEPKDANALAEAIIRLYQNHDLRISMGKAGRELVLSDFTSEKMVERTVHLYNSLLAIHQIN
jgi:glycosyltransferase involved in cell wall biosynthesis